MDREELKNLYNTPANLRLNYKIPKIDVIFERRDEKIASAFDF